MSLRDQVAETTRRALTGDDWYVQGGRYALELTGPFGPWVFVLPVGPESYEVKNVYRTSVRPTMGGTVAEERGLLWREIRVSGTFGLQPKLGYDTSFAPESPIAPSTPISGPGWVQRLVRNILGKYAEWKADPKWAALTTLVWHDMKAGDHWLVVPIASSISRDNKRRMQYPYVLELRAIGDAAALLLPVPTAAGGKLKSAIEKINAGLTRIASAIQEASAFLGEVRYAAATIDSVIDKLTTIVNAAQDFVDGISLTLSVGASFVSSTAALLDAALELMEQTENLPGDVRANYLMASDGLDEILSTREAFGDAYGSTVVTLKSDEGGASNTRRASSVSSAQSNGAPQSAQAMSNSNARSTDQDLIDAGAVPDGREYPGYVGYRDYTVSAVDSLQSIAAKELGDGALWYVLAVVNGLQAPYISPTGAPGTVKPGTVIAIPIKAGSSLRGVGIREGEDPDADILGTGIRLVESASSRANAPLVDWAIDKRTYRDVQRISGVANLSQALQMRMWTENGAIPLLPNYGIQRTIGFGASQAFVTALKLNLRRAVLSDPRVEEVTNLIVKVEDDVIEVDMDVRPVGSSIAQTISTALVG